LEDNDTWWRKNIHPQDKHRIISALDELLAGTETVWWGKYHFRCKDGNYKLILDRLFVVRDAHQVPMRLIGTMQDLTELESLEQQFEQIRKEHQQIIHKAVFQAEENERHHISEELYENINQVLAAINLHLGQAKHYISGQGMAWLEDAQQLLMESISGIRVLAQQLSPVSLQLRGLAFALQELLQTIETEHQISYRLRTNDIDFSRLTLDLQTVLYRIAQHQLCNIAEHSKATKITITIALQEQKIVLRIHDNGAGVDLKNLQYGKGFSTIQERSEAFGGSFNLESTPGKKGFTIEVTI